ncbi:TauD/TfdA family dioxygenase [Dokdonella soli]|uniref:TauD/TfdA family dioxygenase n=1 Tax=Dokdonella soli TaxID=529810 RepID=UPI0031DAE63B
MEDRYSEVVIRTLAPEERGTASSHTQTPLVIEPKNSSDRCLLERFLKLNSDFVLEKIARCGAVLFRGFDIKSSDDFERVILSIKGMQGMAEVLMSEPGRDRADGARFVLHTNTQYKTGGGLDFMGFHSENFYTPDVPRFISFLCMKPSLFGGETGLVDMTGVYSDLPTVLKTRLEKNTFLCNYLPLADLQSRYGVDLAEIEEFCSLADLPLSVVHGVRSVLVYKPCVFEHPITSEKTLVTNISVELRNFGFKPRVLEAFRPDFSDLRWTIHRFVWRNPWIQEIPRVLRHPVATWREMYGAEAEDRAANGEARVRPRRIGFEFTEADVQILARSVRRNFSSFTWRENDVLVIDNLKMEHTGMPGFGKRELRAMICNPTSMTRSAEGAGLCSPPANDFRECLGEQLIRLKRKS